jgi:hypothetical protein
MKQYQGSGVSVNNKPFFTNALQLVVGEMYEVVHHYKNYHINLEDSTTKGIGMFIKKVADTQEFLIDNRIWSTAPYNSYSYRHVTKEDYADTSTS